MIQSNSSGWKMVASFRIVEEVLSANLIKASEAAQRIKG
tara:strand:+ start:264 stop:380 length:117 start_codon:yes stop_codon:yes gene_type:complete